MEIDRKKLDAVHLLREAVFDRLDGQEDLLKAAPRDLVRMWFWMLSCAADVCAERSVLGAWLNAATAEFADQPAGVWLKPVAVDAWRTFSGLPTMSALRAFLDPYAEQLWATDARLLWIVRGETEYRSWFAPP